MLRIARIHPIMSYSLIREIRSIRVIRVRFCFCLLLIAYCLSLGVGCGYHTSSHAQVNLPQGINTVAIPIFVNKTQSYRVEQVLTQAVVREFTSRSAYKVVNNDDGTSDAVLKGTVISTQLSPLTYDSQTGRASSAIVQIVVDVKVLDRHGKTLFENPNYNFRGQYQVSRDVSTFFDESPLAVDRLARDFARSLVADVLEGF